MNIQIGLVMETTELICNQNVFLEFEALASLKSMEKSEIYFFEIGRIGGDEEIFNFTRLLLFSNVKLDEQQKQQAIQSFSSLQNDFFNENTKCVWSSEEKVNDDKIEKEILENWPSHLIIFFRKEKENEEEEKLPGEVGGPSNLKNIICSNLFSPWLLKQVCSEFRINFVEFPQQKSFEKMKMNMEEVKNRKEIVNFFEKKLENLMKMEG
uniref:Uncharacterized protein n=1 Tax=Meloidogyne enterolobii TaxID=390850 RepID=A0A6V7WQ31_MELEN|nr:unnamed protein product [Meloidogyne enterolobii]